MRAKTTTTESAPPVTALEAAGRVVLVLAYAAIAIGMAFAIATTISLRVGNPYDISNAWNEAYGWNPENNFVQVAVMIALVPFVFWGLLILDRRAPRVARAVVVVFAAAVVFCAWVLPRTDIASFDQFHWGEQLAPTLAFLNGAAPFTDLYLLHGVGEDVWRPALGFLLFSGGEPNIGAYVLMTALCRGLAGLAFFATLAVILRSKPVFLLATVWFAAGPFVGISYTKNIPLLIALVLLWGAFTRFTAPRQRLILLGALGVLSGAALLYSIDTGGIVLVLAFGLAVVAPFFDWSADGLRLDRPRARLSRFLPTLVLVGGILVGQLGSLAILGVQGYRDFILTTFVEIPRYQGLTWDYPIPPVDSQQWVLWVTVALMGLEALAIALMVRTDWQSGKLLRSDLVLPAVLWISGLVYLRFAVGRPDLPHFYVSTVLTFVLAFALVGVIARRFPLRDLVTGASAAILVFVLAVPFTTAPPWQWLVNGTGSFIALRNLVTLPGTEDDAWIPEDRVELIDYLRANTEAEDSIYVIEPEPMYYYFTGLRNPTRFAISWFTDPAPYSEEVIHDLEADLPAFIVFDTDSPWETTDGGVRIDERFPEVIDWINENYPTRVIVDGYVLRSR